MIKALKRRSNIFLFLFIVFIYYLSSAGNSPYDYFTRLAGAFLEGRIYLTDNPPWLNELIPIGHKYFVPYPPMPAIIALPFVFFFNNFSQTLLAHILGAGISVFTYKLALKITKNKATAFWMALLTAFGNVIWFLSSVGSSWYIGQITSAFFMTLGIYETLTKRRPFLLGVLLGGAYLSRVHTILAIPFFVFLLIKKPLISKKNIRELFYFGIGLLPFLVFNFLYNYARFGVIWDKGYALIPGVLEEPWYQLGLVHPSYMVRHLEIIFKALPVFKPEFPYIIPSWSGLAIWITSPVFIFLAKASIKKLEVKLAILASALISIPILMHGTNGFAQFGYRFAVDFYPFLFLILIYALPKKLKYYHWVFLILSILVNAWGVVFINKFGWVV